MTFSDRSIYPRLKILEDAYPQIRKEMEAVSHGIKMRTWPEAEKFDGSWKVFGFYHGGRKLESCCKLCPVTTETIESMGKVTMAGFSKLGPNTVILPHFDEVTVNKRIHLGLQVPKSPDCFFVVGNIGTSWQEGKAFVFDPRKEHRAWNNTSEDRIVLLLDFEDFS